MFRSPDKERELFGQLTALGIEPFPPFAYRGDTPDVRFLHKQLPQIVDQPDRAGLAGRVRRAS